MSRATAIILLRHHRGIIAEVERLPAPEPNAEQILKPSRELVAAIEKQLGKTTPRDF